MVEEESLETEKYHFHFYEDEPFRRTETIIADIVRVDGMEMTDNDENELKLFFSQMGKWENFRTAMRNLLDELGIGSKKGTEEPLIEFSYEKYNVDWKRNYESVKIAVRLSPDERHRRNKGGRQSEGVTIEEVAEQVKNIPKWQALKKTLSDLRKQV